jgi:hypothetical protein
MKNWYFAKCDKCKEVKYVMVNNPTYSVLMLGDTEEKNDEVHQWLAKHYGCELTLGWRDDHLDQLWDEGYINKDLR